MLSYRDADYAFKKEIISCRKDLSHMGVEYVIIEGTDDGPQITIALPQTKLIYGWGGKAIAPRNGAPALPFGIDLNLSVIVQKAAREGNVQRISFYVPGYAEYPDSVYELDNGDQVIEYFAEAPKSEEELDGLYG